MAQRQPIGGRRFWILWLAVILILVLAIGVAAMVFVIGPQQQLRQQTQATTEARQAQVEETAAAHQAEVERLYQAGIAFQNAGDCAKAAESFSQVIDIEPSYKDTQDRLVEARACRQAAAATGTAQAIAIAKATAGAQETATAKAKTLAEAKAATATTAARTSAATATAQAAAAVETAYRRGVGYYNLERWAEAKAAFEEVITVDPTYKDVQTMLPKVEAQLAEAQTLTPTATPTPITTPTPEITPTPSVVLVETVQVSADGTTTFSSTTLQGGEQYSLVASGIYRYDEGEAGEFADAQFFEDDNDQWSIHSKSLEIDGVRPDADMKDVTTHIYIYYWTGAGRAVKFRIYDVTDEGEPAYYDNEGSISVAVYKGIVRPTPTASLTATPTAEPALLFFDNFDAGPKGDWEALSGKWGMLGGKYTMIDLSGGSVVGISLVGDPSWQDYAVEVDVTGLFGDDLFAYTSEGMNQDLGMNLTAILVRVQDNGDCVGLIVGAEHIEWGTFINGRWSVANVTLVDGYGEAGTHFKIEARGDVYTAYAGDKMITSFSPDTRFPNGKVGLWLRSTYALDPSDWRAVPKIDNFKVTRLD